MNRQDHHQALFAPTEFWRIVILGIILICGFGTRLYDLTDPPLDYAASRQLRSAMIARGKYYSTLDQAPDWQKEIALKQQSSQEMIEPEIIESITAFSYRLAGGEYLWIARIWSSLFWVVGGLALYSLTRGMVSEDGGVIALIYYLFVPFGLVASRSFQPDPLLTAAIISSWLAFYRWYDSPDWKKAVLAGLAAGFAMLVKSTAVFFLLPGMAAVILTSQKFLATLKNLQVWLIGLLSALPPLIYVAYGLFIVGSLENQLTERFNPQLWDDPAFYLGWKSAISNVTGHYLILIAGLVGIFLVRKGRDRLFLIATWIGYLLYGFGFAYHISTHYYYTLPAIPLLAVTLGAVADRVVAWARKLRLGPAILVGAALVVVLGVSGGYYLLAKNDFRHEPAYYQKVADFVSPASKIVALSQDYGFRLSYYGWRLVYPWKGSEDLRYTELRESEVDPFSERFSQFSSDYDFFIVTRMGELRRQEQLYEELYGHYPILVEGGGYVIFDLRERIE